MSLTDDLRLHILDHYLSGESIDKLDFNDNLIDSGILDSMTLMKFVSYLEKTYDVKISNEELTPDNFETIYSIAQFIDSKIKN